MPKVAPMGNSDSSFWQNKTPGAAMSSNSAAGFGGVGRVRY